MYVFTYGQNLTRAYVYCLCTVMPSLNKCSYLILSRNTSSVDEMLDEFECQSLEPCMDPSYLLLYHQIHCGAVSIEKDKYIVIL